MESRVFHVKHAGILARYSDAQANLEKYANWLASAGIERGLLGPREQERIWDRHIANCAVVEELIPENSVVYDIGSGAGLPGLPIALVRPDLNLVLIEPLLRRANFLNEVVTDLGLTNRVQVIRDRAESAKLPTANVVTARAVAPLGKLLTWALPLVSRGGLVLAMKGASAQEEIEAAESEIAGRQTTIELCGHGVVEPATLVVKVVC